jgi:hypothetical protein
LNLYKSRFGKDFVKELINAYDGENDVVVITMPSDEPGGKPHQKFYAANDPELLNLEHSPLFPSGIIIKPYEEFWFEKHKDKFEKMLLKNPKENIDGN